MFCSKKAFHVSAKDGSHIVYFFWFSKREWVVRAYVKLFYVEFTLAFFFAVVVFEFFLDFVFYLTLILYWVCNVQHIVVFVVVTNYFFFFFSCRQQLLKVTFESPPISPKTPTSVVKCKTPSEKGQACKTSFLSNYFQKKPKTSPTKEPWLHSSFTQSGAGRETSGNHRSKKVDLHSSSTPVVVKEEPTNAVEENIQLLKSVYQEDTACTSRTFAPEVVHSSSPSKDIKPIIKGEAFLSLVQSNAGTQCDAFWVTSLLGPATSHLPVTQHLSYPSCMKQVLYHTPAAAKSQIWNIKLWWRVWYDN